MSITVIQTRIDLASKRRAEEVLAPLGIGVSDAVRMFICQVGIDRELPFKPSLRGLQGELPEAAGLPRQRRAGRKPGPKAGAKKGAKVGKRAKSGVDDIVA
ncbi:hypothetical protein FACS1894186_0350 [Alphaproteobacteria bacterium]|nr:hypothetical protein FACS1894186_0350 [Alphaproteobacteria bacterium]